MSLHFGVIKSTINIYKQIRLEIQISVKSNIYGRSYKRSNPDELKILTIKIF